MPSVNESQVITEVRNGDGEAFAELVAYYQEPIIRYLYRLTGDHGVAQDLAQETFLNAYRGILKSDSDISFRAWLYRIATNNARQYHRRSRLLSFISLTKLRKDGIPSNEVSSDDVEQSIIVQDIMLRIPYDQRQCMILYLVEGFKYREIAEVIGISEDAVRMRVARGRDVFIREYGVRARGVVR